MRLKKGNVERITTSEQQAQELVADGFVRIDSMEGPDVPGDGGVDKPLEEMNVEELRAYAKERGVGGYYSLNKAELIQALEDAQ